ncbi:MAG: glutamate-cysteine ligase family protein, partial [Actinomycetota bacterium]|nr:glutamate-cysteine ligase family protein [Actinomycetota bacterium]
FYEEADTGFASVRPKLAQLLPRQGIPPSFASWESYARALRWGADPDAFPELRSWWWELRLHPGHGTLELRVPDAQSTVEHAIAIAGFAHCLVAWLGERHDSGEGLLVAPSWRIAENRFSAARHGVEGTMADLQTGERRSTRTCLENLLDALSPTAERLHAGRAIELARVLVGANGAILQRRTGDARAAACWMVERFQP